MPDQPIIAKITLLLMLFLIAIGCEREDFKSYQPRYSMPVAKAGFDSTIYLPDQRVLVLNGNFSYDPDGRLTTLGYEWLRLSGPEVKYFQVSGSQANMIIVETGVYQFELKVTDAHLNVDRDTVTITATWRSPCDPIAVYVNSSLELKTMFNKSMPIDVSLARGGKHIAFAGGRTDQDDGWGGVDKYSDAVYVYDMVSNTVYENHLSQARSRIGIAVTNNDVFFAGGFLLNEVSDVVDIFSISARSMSKAKISVPRSSISSIAAGNKVFFAGGRLINNGTTDVVDIFDQGTGTWSVSRLSQARANISVIASGTKVFFAGGDLDFGTPSARVDVYDLNTGQWSTLELPSPRFNISSSLVGEKVLFAGGYRDKNFTKVNQVDLLDHSSLTIKSECLISVEHNYMDYGSDLLSTVVNGRDYYYLNYYQVTRYQSDTQKWSFSVISPYNSWIGLASEGDKLFGITLDPDSNTLGYVGKLMIHQIGF